MTLPDPIARVLDHLEPELRAIRDAFGRSSADPSDLPAFASLPEVQRLLESVRPEGASPSDPTASVEYLSFLHALYAFWGGGGTTMSASRDALTAVLGDDGSVGIPDVPNGACYVQLPAHWFWAQVDNNAPHEPVDGFFIVAGPHGPTVTVVALLGLHVDRVGFSQIAVTVRAADARSAFGSLRTDRFAPTMEGGDRTGLHSVTSTAELLVLAQLALAAAAG